MPVTTLDLPVALPGGDECERCAGRLQTRLLSLRGISDAALDAQDGTLSVTYDPDTVTLARIQAEAQRIGATIAEEIGHDALALEDLDCPDCAASIERAVRKVPGVLWASANFAAARLHFEYERSQTSLEAIRTTAEAHGVRACPIRPTSTGERAGAPGPTGGTVPWWQRHRRAIATCASTALAFIALAVSAGGAAQVAAAIYAAAIAMGGWTTARAAWRAARAGSLDMNVLMTLAVIGAAAVGEWFEGATVVVLYNVGSLLQSYTLDRTRQSIRALMELSPNTARLLRGGETVEVAVEALRVGDVVRIAAGDTVPIDGRVVAGVSAVNQAAVTGESVPVDRQPGDDVFAGTLTVNGSLDVEVTRRFKDTTLARIVHSVEEAQAQRAPAQQFIDAFARVYTPLVVGAAVLTAVLPPALLTLAAAAEGGTQAAGLWTEWLMRALALLLVACPCALIISTPVAVVAAIGAASRRGALIKGGAHLETLGRVRAVLFDKTGTLTEGRFTVTDVVPFDGAGPLDVLRPAAALEAHSSHPLAAGVVEAAERAGVGALPAVAGFSAAPGTGISGVVAGRPYRFGAVAHLAAAGIEMGSAGPTVQALAGRGRTVAVLAEGERLIGAVAMADTPRPQAAEAIAELGRMGIREQAMLTGDNASVAAEVAGSVGLAHFQAGLLPEMKLEAIDAYRRRNRVVAMVGDGVNDAPALAAADVSIVMGAVGSDTAMETADVALMADDLSRLPWLIGLGRRTRAVIVQNVAFSLATKGVLVAAALLVGVPLWVAVAGDVGVSLLVTLNALRLARA